MLGTYYRDADIYCLPSLYEGFPLAILEAMAAALPVVATRVSGNPEAVDDGVTGLLVKPEKAGELADKLLELLRDPERAREMGRRGREKLEERFTIDRIAEKYLRLWHNLLDPASGEATSEPADSDPAASEPAASARSDPSNHPP